MLTHSRKRTLRRECQGIMQLLPILAVAAVLSVIIAPVLTLAASHVVSPLSPISPIRPPTVPLRAPARLLAETNPPLPDADVPVVETAVSSIAEATLQPVPPPPPLETTGEPTTPPTLWIVAGLAIVGAIVGGLIVLKKD